MFWRLVDTDLASPAYTAACDEAMVRARGKNLVPNTLHLYRRDRPTISLGYFEAVEESVDLDAARKHRVQLVRRLSGGSAIYTDRDQLIYSAITSREFLPEDPNQAYELICSALVRGIGRLGLEAAFKPINDVLIGGRKVSGSAQKRERDVVIQHGTLIMDADFDIMFEVLRTSGEKVRTREGMTSLAAELGRKPAVEEVKSALVRGFEDALGVTMRRGELTRFEERCTRHLVETRYGTEEYTLRR